MKKTMTEATENKTDQVTAEIKTYMEEHKIHDLFTKIIQDVLKERPQNPLQKIANFIYSEYNIYAANSGVRGDASTSDLNSLPTEIIEPTDDGDNNDESDSDDDEDDDGDEMVELTAFKVSNKVTRDRRVSVSASVMRLSDAKNTETPVFKKTEEEKQELHACVKYNAIFSKLVPDDVSTIISAMEKCEFAEGDVIIKEGDDKAEHFFVLERGSAEAFKGEKSVKKYTNKEAFGELALLYNQPRAATVKATSEIVAWRLDRDTFKQIIVRQTILTRERYVGFLHKCVLFQELSEFEIMTLADSMNAQQFIRGDAIITQGDKGASFYIVEKGEVDCIVDGKSVGQLHPGSYFGEIALLYDQPRQASVLVSSDELTVLVIDRKTFQRLMGPLGDILRRNMAKYNLKYGQMISGMM